MPSRPRQSGASQVARRLEMPDYEALTAPLTVKSQHDLSTLQARHSLKALDKFLVEAITILSENAAGINDALHSNTELLQLQQAELDRMSSPPQDRIEQVEQFASSVDEMRTEVEDLTKRIEESVRKTIDAQQHTEDARTTLSDLSRDLASSNTGVTQTQRSRRNQGPTQTQDSSGMPASFVPTEPGTQSPSTQPPTAPITTFRSTLTRKKDKYTTFSHSARYAENNSYRTFRRLLHDAQHPDGDTPLPHQNTWFPTTARAAPGVTQPRGTQAQSGASTQPLEDDSDEDLAIARETLSTRCPLTLLDFVDPVTSSKCPHSFEREAITGLIRASALTVSAAGGPGGSGAQRQVKAVQCPVPGCSMMLTEADLGVDPVLVRRIGRLIKGKRKAEEMEGAQTGRGVVDIGSSDVESDEVRTGTARKRVVKGERRRVGSEEL